MKKEVVLRGAAVCLSLFFWYFESLSFGSFLFIHFLLHFASYFETRRLNEAVDRIYSQVSKLPSSPSLYSPSSSRSSLPLRSSAQAMAPSATPTPSSSSSSSSPLSSSSSSPVASSSSLSEFPAPSDDGEVLPFGDTPCPEFPFLVMDVGSSAHKEIRPNYRYPIPIENEWFKGKCVMKVRSDPIDPVFRPYFEGKRRNFELQIQGSFKATPPGLIYMGIEVPPPALSLSFFSRGFANFMLSLLKKMVPDSHYSMGGKHECPHIVFPLISAMDTFIVTNEGEIPPLLGVEPFPETSHRDPYLVSDPSRREVFRVGPTYSFSFHSMYLNLTPWKVSNLPGGEVSLSSFWGDRPIRLVAYDLQGDSDPKGAHLVDSKNYYFCFEITHRGGDVFFPSAPPPRPISPLPSSSSSSSTPSPSSHSPSSSPSPSSSSPSHPSVSLEPPPLSREVAIKSVIEPHLLKVKEDHLMAVRGGDGRKSPISPRPALSSPTPSQSTSPQKYNGRMSPDVLAPTPRRGPSSAIIVPSSGSPSEAVVDEIITDIQIPASVRVTGLTIFLIQFTILRCEGKDKEVRTVAKTPEDIRTFARMVKGRGLKIYNRNLKKRSPNYIDKKRDAICARLRAIAELDSEISSKLSSSSDDDSNSSDGKEGESLESRSISPPSDNASYKGSLQTLSLSLFEAFRLFIKPSPTDEILLNLSPWQKAGYPSIGEEKGGSKSEEKERGGSKHSSLLVRANTETFWTVNWSVLTAHSLQCYDISSKKTPKTVIYLKEVLKVVALSPDLSRTSGCGDTAQPFSGFHFFKIEMITKVAYFFTKSEEDRDLWISCIQAMIENLKLEGIIPDRPTGEPVTPDVADQDEDSFIRQPDELPKLESTPRAFGETSDYIHSTTQMTMSPVNAQPSNPSSKKSKIKKSGEEYYRKVGKRKVLNGKRLSFRPVSSSSEPSSGRDPLSLSDELLSSVLNLTQYTSPQFDQFADATNLLKSLNISSLSTSERMAFFLNIFHTLLLHALLVLGPPPADLRRWNSFFHKVSYECVGHILSLAEIEHNILRSKGSKPKLLWALIPKWSNSDPRRAFALPEVDPRVNILLNYGSISCPPFISKFSSDSVEQQFDHAVTQILDYSVQVDVKNKRLRLPKMIYWYQHDFGSSDADTVKWIAQHGSPKLIDKLLSIDPTGRFRTSVMVKYRKYKYDFRNKFDSLNLEEEVNVKDGNQSESEDDDSGRALEFEVNSERIVVGGEKGKEEEEERKEERNDRKIVVIRSKSSENLAL